jgi:hypothetical protein
MNCRIDLFLDMMILANQVDHLNFLHAKKYGAKLAQRQQHLAS